MSLPIRAFPDFSSKRLPSMMPLQQEAAQLLQHLAIVTCDFDFGKLEFICGVLLRIVWQVYHGIGNVGRFLSSVLEIMEPVPAAATEGAAAKKSALLGKADVREGVRVSHLKHEFWRCAGKQ